MPFVPLVVRTLFSVLHFVPMARLFYFLNVGCYVPIFSLLECFRIFLVLLPLLFIEIVSVLISPCLMVFLGFGLVRLSILFVLFAYLGAVLLAPFSHVGVSFFFCLRHNAHPLLEYHTKSRRLRQ